MHSLRIIHPHPVFIWQQLSVNIISHIRISKLVDLSVRSESLSVHITVLSLDQSEIPLKCLFARVRDQDVRVDAEEEN